jgi:hypothetical protein
LREVLAEQFVVIEVTFDELADILAGFSFGAVHGLGADAEIRQQRRQLGAAMQLPGHKAPKNLHVSEISWKLNWANRTLLIMYVVHEAIRQYPESTPQNLPQK